jgi:hypothetical protein
MAVMGHGGGVFAQKEGTLQLKRLRGAFVRMSITCLVRCVGVDACNRRWMAVMGHGGGFFVQKETSHTLTCRTLTDRQVTTE